MAMQHVHGSFPDYDCKWAGSIDRSGGGNDGEGGFATWTALNVLLQREAGVSVGIPPGAEALMLAGAAVAQLEANTTCPLGFLTACLALRLAGRVACDLALFELPLLPALATSWPVLRLLRVLRVVWPKPSQSTRHDCTAQYHPSVDWDEYFENVNGYAAEAFDEDKMETIITEKLRDATEAALGIVWKYSSAAVSHGRTIAAWTEECMLGVASAFVLRAASLVIGDLDVFKMVESLLLNVQERTLGFFGVEELLGSRWPLFELLHKLAGMKKRTDDLALAPGDPQLNVHEAVQEDVDPFSLSATAQEVSKSLLLASPGPVMVTFAHASVAGYLKGYLRHAREVGFEGRLLLLPQSEEILALAVALGASCLPVLSVYPELSKYALLALSARLGVDVIFSQLDVYWLQNPFHWLPRRPWTSSDAADVGSTVADVLVGEEFYSNQTRPGLMLVRGTERAAVAMASIASWLLRFPFSVERPAIRYLLEPDRPGYVPSVSFLRADRHSGRGGPLVIQVLDAENEFITSDGWFGEFERIVCFEFQNLQFRDEEQLRILETFYGDLQGTGAAKQFVARSKKPMSPKRPMEALSQTRFETISSPGDKGGDVGPVDPDIFVLHVNFADGCCEREQAKSSATAIEFGANASRALDGSALSNEFRSRNARLLSWVRAAELTSGKTPSGKVGYYVWKPYIVLQTLLDPAVPEGAVVLWTDAGVHFISPLRPLVRRYLQHSDVSATETPMMEMDVSKRDSILLLDADYYSIISTNQIATGIILARKTPLAIRFMEQWLKACEDERIITEEPSRLGLPDYYTFRHHNDDQSAFSLLFKKYGFKPFLQAERDTVVLAARNIAKFLAASDAFALGTSVTQDQYISAADAAAAA
eukprot:TRINITY_DN61108_c0_g1_i1.p1 TRINITY_DN61108_c0_g1~~TRINITY_DN61108_c0_g1_i1.p1  ORF type:complete len:878 (-),score=164.19 TRINITY_DN61108_c0_g1_i1:544-3177(-)